MSTRDKPDKEPGDPSELLRSYEEMKETLTLSKRFTLKTITDKLEQMNKDQLLAYAKAITAQKFAMDQTYRNFIEAEF